MKDIENNQNSDENPTLPMGFKAFDRKPKF
jgi:hypothetical protein